MAQLRDLLINGQSRFLGPAMFNDTVKFDNLIYLTSDARAEGDFIPSASVTYNLGTSSLKWKNVYAQIFYGALSGTVTGSLVGNADTATTLKTARNINGTAFNGSADIVTSLWGTARTISISDTAGTTGTSVNGSADVTLILPTTITGFTKLKATTFEGALSGNATSATKATQDGDGKTISSTYLKLAGGTMSGDIIFPNNKGIIQNQNSASNYTTAITWLQGGVSEGKYNPSIGHHNTGDTDGAIVLLPHSIPTAGEGETQIDPWSGTVGLYISKTRLRWKGKDVLHTGATITTAQGGTGITSHTANRLVWSTSTTQLQATNNHYVDANRLGVNYTSKSDYNLYVNGSSYLSAAVSVGGSLTVASTLTANTIARISQGLAIAQTTGTGAGISLHSNITANTAPTFGLMFAKTSNFNTHGAVTGDWATYFTMNDGAGRGWIFTKGTNNIASINNDGVATFSGVGNGNTYIQHPPGGEHIGESSVTGYLTITLPVKFTNTMIKFKVSIYSHEEGTNVDYIIGGYNRKSDTSWQQPSAICIGKKGAKHSNHSVTFGQNADGYAQIQIGSTGTVWKYPNINITDITLGHTRVYADWQKAWTISFTTTQQSTSKTIINTYVGYNAQNSDFATRADYLQVSSTSTRDTGLYYYKGQPVIGTTAGNAVAGSNGTLGLWSYPEDSGTAINANNTVNVQIMRMMWGPGYWSEFFFSPNNQDVWTRSVQNGSAKAWRKIIDTGNLSNYINGTTNKIAKFTGANSVGDSNISDDGSTITLGKSTILKASSSNYTEGLRILPAADNGWALTFYSNSSTSTTGTHVGGWLIGKRGAAGTYGAIGDFTIEDNGSNGKGLTLHKNNGGATLYGSFKAIGKISATSAAGSWISGKTITNASYSVSTKQSSDKYHPAFAITSNSGNVWNIGGLGDTIGIYGYYAARTANGTDYSTTWNTSTGAITHTGAMSIGKTLSVTGNTALASMINITHNEKVTSGTAEGYRNTLCIYGETYGNDPAYTKIENQFSYGDPGPQIVFGKTSDLTQTEKIAIIYTDHNDIGAGNSLSLVSTETNAYFIAPTIKALKGLIGTLTGNVVGNVTGHATTSGALGTLANGTVTKTVAGSSTLPVYFSNGVPSPITNLYLSTTETSDKIVSVKNGNGAVELLASTNRGLYDRTKSQWIIYGSQDGKVVFVPRWNPTSIGCSTTKPIYFDANGQPQPITSYEGTAASAVKATKDGDGNVITSTYAVKNHASTATTYGLGSNDNYGHVKLSNATNSTSDVSKGIAATPAAVKAAYDLAASKISTNTHSIELNQSGTLAKHGGYIDFHFHNDEKKPLNSSGNVVETTPDHTSRIVEDAAGQISINNVKFKNGVVTGAFTGTLTGSLVGNASTATTLQTARNFTIGDTAKSFNGSGDVTWTSSEIGYRHTWTAVVQGQTWSRLCLVQCGNITEGGAYILNISATRGNVVYNDTFLIKAHHSKNGKIIKLSGHNYSHDYQVRLLVNSNGDSYFELYDNCNGIAATAKQNVHCNLIPIHAGVITKYEAFTSGATIPSEYSVKQTMIVTNEDIQANIRGDLTGNASTASYANNADTVDGKHASDFSTSTHQHTVSHTPAGTVSQPTFTGSAVMTSTGANSQKTMYSITSVGSAPSLTASVSSKCLTLTFSAGSVPTRESATVSLGTHTHSVTAAGTVSQPTFTGTAATVTTSAPA